MSRTTGPGRRRHAQHINHERWMVSFADFMTLLFSLFVVLFAISTVDQQKLTEVAASTKEAFGIMESEGNSILNPRSDQLKPIPPIVSQPSMPPPPASAEVIKRLEKVIGKNSALAAAVQLRTESRGVVIQLKDTRLFASGSAELRSEILPELRRMAGELDKLAQPMRIEGHTDNVPINRAGLYRSNWELSAARATSVLQFMLSNTHQPPARFSVAGYGEHRPIASNASEQGRARNRRVDIVLLNSEASREEPPAPPLTPGDDLNQQLNQKLNRRS